MKIDVSKFEVRPANFQLISVSILIGNPTYFQNKRQYFIKNWPYQNFFALNNFRIKISDEDFRKNLVWRKRGFMCLHMYLSIMQDILVFINFIYSLLNKVFQKF